MSDFGERLRVELARKDWDQTELARRLQTRKGTVGKWVRGTVPDPPQLLKLAEVLEVDPGYLAFGGSRNSAAASALELIQQVLRQLETDPGRLQRMVDWWEAFIKLTENGPPAGAG